MKKSKNYWFKAKNYGWGWYPASWQGWVVLAGFVLASVIVFADIDSNSHSVSDTLLNFLPRVLLLLIILVLICFVTGEKPEWRWGGKKI